MATVASVSVPGRVRPAARIIMQTTDPGHGLGLYVAQCAIALAGRGLHLRLLCPGNFAYTAKLRAAGVEVIQTAERETGPAGMAARLLRNVTFAAKLASLQYQVVRAGDIVHLQSIFNLPLGFAFFLVAKLRGGCLVLTVHDPVPHRWRFGRGLRWIERTMLATAYHWSDHLLVHNEAGKQALAREFGTKLSRIAVIPHGAYAQEDCVEAYPAFDRVRVLAFGSIRENKGLHLAIEAVQKLNEDPAGAVPVVLTIAGTPYNAAEVPYWEYCKRCIARSPAQFEVIERFVEDREVPLLFARHHCAVLPYTQFFSESGVAILALSHARAILATATGGAGELIEQGDCGLPIAGPSVAAVEGAIAAAIRLGPARLQQMGEHGRTFVHQVRSWEANANETAKVYSTLLHPALA